VLLALTGYEAALLAVAAVFIAFALIVALVIPRSRPEFPGGRLGIFLAICVALFACQITAVLVLAEVGEADEPAHEEAAPTETMPTETTETTETTEGTGDPTAGKEIFVAVASPSCSGCHTLSDAGASGSVGPNLDATKPSYETVVDRVTNGTGVMPSFHGQFTEQQIQDVAAYVSSVAGS